MIVWINGTFGVGKTTTAALVAQRAQWRLFDPEHVGFLLADNMRDVEFDDFQELPPWRALVPAVADEIYRFTNCPAMVAVQSVLVEDYWNELYDGLDARGLAVFHVVLTCDEDELRRRIEADEVEAQARDWRLDHIGEFQRAREWMLRSADLVIDTTATTPAVVARQIVEAANGN